MLYTGGTTGMPKGVMYAMGGLTASFVEAGFPLLQLTPPADASQIAPLVTEAAAKGERLISIPACPLMHGTGVWLGTFIPHLAGGTVITLERRSLDADELLEAVQRHRVNAIAIVGDAFSKPILRALDDASAARPAVRHVLVEDHHLLGGHVDGRGQGGAARPHGAARARRRHRLHRGLDGAQHHHEGPAPVDGQVQPDADDEGVHRRRPPGRARLRRDRHGGGGRQRPARLLQGRREVGPHVPGHRRRALLLPGRPGHGERGRLAQPPRTGQPGHQHRRREGVPRGGRGGDQAGRHASTTAWSSACPTTASARPSPRSSPSPRERRPTSRPSSPRSSSTWPATRRPSAWSSSRRCRGRPTARPTTAPLANRPSPRAEAVDPGRPPALRGVPPVPGRLARLRRTSEHGAAPEPDDAGPSRASGAAASHQRARSRARAR